MEVIWRWSHDDLPTAPDGVARRSACLDAQPGGTIQGRLRAETWRFRPPLSACRDLLSPGRIDAERGVLLLVIWEPVAYEGDNLGRVAGVLRSYRIIGIVPLHILGILVI
jgi:hypothetical protein